MAKDPVRILIYKLPARVRPAVPILAGILIQLTLGLVYTFGNIIPYIVSYMRKNVDPDLSVKTMLFIANFEAGFPFSFLIGGLLENKFGARAAAAIGCSLVTCGTFLSYFTVQRSFIALLFTMGIMFGLGSGIAYNSVLVCAIKWCPNNVGFVSGLIVAGFGCGAFVFSPIETAYVNPWNYSPGTGQYFTQPDLLEKVPFLFLILGVIFLVTQLVGCALLSSPEPGEYEDNLLENEDEEHEQATSVKPLEMFKSGTFYWICFSYFFNMPAIVSVAAYFKAFGEMFVDDDEFLAWVSSFSAIFNTGGRIIWGIIADKSSYQTTMTIVSLCLSFLLLTLLSTTLGGKFQLLLWICSIFGVFSANFSLFPLVTAKCFGQKYLGINYGIIIFSGFLGGLATSTLSDILLDKIEFGGLWFICAGTSFITFLLTATIQKTKYGRAAVDNINELYDSSSHDFGGKQ